LVDPNGVTATYVNDGGFLIFLVNFVDHTLHRGQLYTISVSVATLLADYAVKFFHCGLASNDF
jgi:hypothetical protein